LGGGGRRFKSARPDLTVPSLAPLTTLRLGGPAGSLVSCSTQEELIDAVRSEEPVLVLAGGSNVVVADEGFPGLVARVQTSGFDREGERLTVEAGEPWDDVVAMTVSEGLAGFECLSGIPGSTGATPIQNVGAYGQEVSATVRSVRVLDRAEGRVEELPPERCGFGYRTSIFKYSERHLVLAVTYELRRSELSEPVRYPELARTLDVEVGERAPLADVREAVLGLRRGKGMVVDPADPDSVSAGSFFTNPFVSEDELAEVARRADAPPPAFPADDGRVKTSAAWLIERAGFTKGYGDGPVGLSTKHTLALVNRGGGTTAQLVALAREIAGEVRERFGVELRPEPVFVGHSW
jgi:UDP-N-acetylmuramate dehydrogenase